MRCYIKFYFVLVIVLVLGLCSISDAQRVVNVAPTEFGILNTTIDGDTLSDGSRVDSNTVYVLERGTDKYYVLDGSIENRYPLTIISEGTGDLPKLIPGVVGGGESSRPFRPRDDLTIKGLYVSNKDQDGGLNTRTIRISANGIRITVDNCHLDYDGQSAFRFDGDDLRVFVTNSIVSNIGQTNNPNNGRGFDDRGRNIDSLVVENCTFYNITSRVLRDGGGWIRYAKFNHNTLVNVAQFVLTFGEVVEASFTNNIVINGAFIGDSENDEDPYTGVGVDSLLDSVLVATYTQVVDIRNNNFYRDPAIVAAYPDSVIETPNFNPTAQAFIDDAGSGATIISESLTFTDGPGSPQDVMLGMWADETNGTTTAPPFDEGDAGAFGEPGFGIVPFDFAYPTGAASYTASVAGQPLGSLTWFDLIIDGIQDVEDLYLPDGFRLLGNYPNPFNPSTTIRFDLDKPAVVTITIYDNLGQVVKTMQPQKMNAGLAQEISINPLGLSTGVYLYQVTAEFGSVKQTASGRMLLLK